MENKPEDGIIFYVVTSCKGGIGKSTVCANLAVALAERGRRVLCIDCDYSNRSLDLIFGVDGTASKGIDAFVCDPSVRPEDSVMRVRDGELFFIPGPEKNVISFGREAFETRVKEAAVFYGCDTVLIDTPGASDGILPVVAPIADTGIVVASHMPTAIRGAERTGKALSGLGVEERFLIVNRFCASDVLAGRRPGVNDLIDRTYIRLLGVIPDSRDLELAQESGKLAVQIKRAGDKTADAFAEIAARLCGERVPLMSYLPARLRRKLTRSNFKFE
ncbi:MAG: P-loop NTPase [Clostridia bacterium]|nr:P-loop NTPase [Clostridia bacterium]